ncbi:MAG TPA: class I SAM-dependent methyltransferase [Steroidobacteraceae bacterium]|jgi:SAM-dependent methyltransferase|nr:class I SAM-dependent methyltransferase [Steroidobacteraceae bacterium]
MSHLDRPLTSALWRLGQALLAPGAERGLRAHLERCTAERAPGERVLDVGAGPRSRLTGVGLNPVVVDCAPWAVAAVVAHGHHGVVGDAARLPFRCAAFDSVWSFGLLHHLPDAAARAALEEMLRVVKPLGYVAVVDGVRPRTGRPLARWLRNHDRGRWMRGEPELRALLPGARVWRTERFEYAWTGLEALLCVSQPAGAA